MLTLNLSLCPGSPHTPERQEPLPLHLFRYMTDYCIHSYIVLAYALESVLPGRTYAFAFAQDLEAVTEAGSVLYLDGSALVTIGNCKKCLRFKLPASLHAVAYISGESTTAEHYFQPTFTPEAIANALRWFDNKE